MHGVNVSNPEINIGADLDAEPENELPQRRWFAALTATRRLEAECRQLLNALCYADEAWRRACRELAEYEALTDALEQQLTCRHETPARSRDPIHLPIVSAA
jgi:hypothetical protein